MPFTRESGLLLLPVETPVKWKDRPAMNTKAVNKSKTV